MAILNKNGIRNLNLDPPCAKKRGKYRTLAEAKKALDRFMEDHPWTELEAYQCTYCHKFHLGRWVKLDQLIPFKGGLRPC